MGGNLFKLGRKPRAEYLEIEAEVRAGLDDLVGPDAYRIPRYYASKPDFGDLDVVLSQGAVDALGGFAEFCAAIAERFEVTRNKSVGHVYSTVYRDFQVDYFIRATELLDATYHYLSFNDLGNLLGKIYRRLGLKYGEQGLSYVFRRAAQESYKAELPVSRDWARTLALIGLDVAVWEAGFATLEHMFAWVVSSPYFSVAPYEQRSSTTEKRAKQRTTMLEFLGWLEREAIDTRYAYGPAASYLPMIVAAFPEIDLEAWLAEQRQLEREDEQLRAKFDGTLVRDWTKLEGPELGAFMRRFTSTYARAQLLAMDPDTIEAAVLAFPREG